MADIEAQEWGSEDRDRRLADRGSHSNHRFSRLSTRYRLLNRGTASNEL